MRGQVEYDIARILIENGADLESLNRRKQTPLHSFFSPLVLAVALKHASSLEEFPADARGMNLAHYFSWTNSSTPSDIQCLPCVSSILCHSDAEGRKPIHLAAQRGNIAVVEFLLSQTASPLNTLVDNDGNTLGHHAVLSVRALDVIRLLLSRGHRLEAQNRKGHTPLQHAACWGTAEAPSYLLELDPDSLTARDARGNDLLALARSAENERVETWLLSRYRKQLQEVRDGNRDHRVEPRQKESWEKVCRVLCMFLVPILVSSLLSVVIYGLSSLHLSHV